MSHDDMIAYILNAISTDAGLLTLMRAAVTNGIYIQTDDRLAALVSQLQAKGF